MEGFFFARRTGRFIQINTAQMTTEDNYIYTQCLHFS
jgi:hypothetical protein